MARTITNDPVTRIEGHARVLLDLDDGQQVKSARLVVNELRGFERMLVGMEADRMPLVTARICGVCPVPHALASTKALETAFRITPPPAGVIMRRLISLGHVIHSHALHLFALGGPDLYFGLSADPAIRNVVGLVKEAPELAKKALRLRTLGQRIVETVGGRGIHPVTVVLGGVSFELSQEERDLLRRQAAELVEVAKEVAPAFRELLLKLVAAEPALADAKAPMHDVGLLAAGGKMDHYDGALSLGGPDGVLRGEIQAQRYAEFLEERTFDYSYMKPVWVHWGGEEYTYRVGPLARVNLVSGMDTPAAAAELAAFRAACPRPCQSMVMQHWAKLVEVLWACEQVQVLLESPDLSGPTRVGASVRAGRGVGVAEAPRGTLIHEYEVDAKGIVRKANLIIATQQSYHSINRSLEQAANAYAAGKSDAALLNAVEFAVRCHDPCLACATHAVGQMPIEIELRRGGEVVRSVRRGG